MQRVRAILQQISVTLTPAQANAHTADAAYFTNKAKPAKRIKDMYVHEVVTMRYRCNGCGHVFTHYPQGVDRSEHRVRLRALM